MFGITILLGALVGLALGLTGGGGGVFAVPLLVYGLGRTPQEAVGISLASVGLVALIGLLPPETRKFVEWRSGFLFAASGMAGAPLGAMIAGALNDTVLLALFALLMLVIAQRMWVKARDPQVVTGVCNSEAIPPRDGPACQRDAKGQLRWNARCTRLLLVLGLLTGVLSGLFGIGGGFVIVPALVLFSGMAMHRAVATSLLAIGLISVSGVASFLASGQTLPLPVAVPFMAGGVLGLFAGRRLGQVVQGTKLQRSFAVAIVAVAVFVIGQSLHRFV